MKTEMKASVTSRRAFLKKAAYAAPAIMVLGSLTTASAAAGGNGNGNGVAGANSNAGGRGVGPDGTPPGIAAGRPSVLGVRSQNQIG